MKYIGLIIPFVLIISYMGFLVLLKGAAPTSEEIVQQFAAIYARYGYEIIFFGAFLESLVVANFFVPGAMAMALGAVFARSGQVELGVAILCASLGAITGFVIDFALGYFGLGEVITKMGYTNILNRISRQVEQAGLRSFSLGYIHPNIGSLVSLASGTLKMDFKKFVILASLSTFVWFSFWGILIFTLGDIFLKIFTRYVFALMILIASIGILTIIFEREEKGVNKEKA